MIMKTSLSTCALVLTICLIGLSSFLCPDRAAGAEAAWIQTGKLAGAVSLKGEHCLLGYDVGEMDRMTLALWIKPFKQEHPETSIFSCFNWEQGALHWLLRRDGRLNLCINGCAPDEVLSKGRLRPKAWNHLALVYDSRGATARLFINGKLDRDMRYEDAVTLELWDFCVGAWNVEPRAFNGEIDDLRIYSRALKDQEVLALARGKASRNALELWWKLDETEGQKIRDYSGQEHHGELIAAAFEQVAEPLVGKTLTTELGGQTYTWVFSEKGKVRVSGGEAGDGLDARYEQEGEEVIIAVADTILEGIYEHGRLEIVEMHEEGAGDENEGEDDWRDAEVTVSRSYTDTLLNAHLAPLKKLLFVKRQTYHSSHFYTDFIDGCSRFGGNLCVLDLETGKVTDLIPEMKQGIFGRFDLHFDADRVVFDWKEAEGKGFRIFEIDIDPVTGLRTGGPRQITFPPDDEAARIKKYDNHQNGGTARMYYHQTDDMHPCYLPDGGIVFTSSRCEYGTLCDAPDHLSTTVLHRMDADGSNMEQLTNSPVSEFSPSVMQDGRILYTRWEYVDKGQLGIKCLWAMRPEGSGSVEIYGNDIHLPPTFLHGRQIPGKSHLFVMLGTPHYPQSGIGTVIRVDTTQNIRTRAPMTYMTPYVDIRQEPGWNHYENGQWRRHTNGPLYMDPFPLSETLFLVAHNPDKKWDDPKAYGLYLLNDKGVHQTVHIDPDTSCWQPIPLQARTTPPVLATPRDEILAQQNLAECFVYDIYQGMEGIKRGEVKYIRVMEQIPRPWDCRQFWEGVGHTDLISRGTALAAKAMHGIVPVYEDGSAHFYVPADRNIYFQALDQNFMELQRERTYINYRPGETRSCVGCHEKANSLPLDKGSVIAMAKPPVMPGPQPGDSTGQQVIHFPSYVQPVLDRHCVSCHGPDEPQGGLELTGTLTDRFSRSYENIMKRGLVKTYREASDWGGSPYAPPKTIGSYASKFIMALRKGEQHKDLNLPLADFARLATWVDASGVYYGSYWGRRRLKYKDHPNFRPVPSFAEALSTVCPLPVAQR